MKERKQFVITIIVFVSSIALILFLNEEVCTERMIRSVLWRTPVLAAEDVADSMSAPEALSVVSQRVPTSRLLSESKANKIEEKATIKSTALPGITLHWLKDKLTQTVQPSLIRYLDSLLGTKYIGNLVLFQWDTRTGQIDKITPIRQQSKAGWLKDEYIQHFFNETFKFEDTNNCDNATNGHYRVALLYNSDVLHTSHGTIFDVVPPVPLLVYTMLNHVNNEHGMFWLIPDPYDLGLNQFLIHYIRRYFASKNTNANQDNITYEDYMNRENVMVWRGSTHSLNSDPVRYALLQIGNNTNNSHWLNVADSSRLENRINTTTLAESYRYHIDVGGVSGTAWGGLRWKMCASGGLVFRVNSFGQDWWHHTIEPYKHYIPVKDDLSDLFEQYQWAEMHPHEAYEISVNGRNKCLETYTTESAREFIYNKIITLQPLSNELQNEVDTIFEKYVSKYFLGNHSKT